MNNKLTCLIFSFVFISYVAKAAEICGEIKQGEVVMGKNVEALEVRLNGKKYPVTEDGMFLLALGRDEPKNGKLELAFADKVQSVPLEVEAAKWDVQRINGVAQQKVTPDSSNDAEILREQKDVAAALKIMQKGDFWRNGFIVPLDGRVSGTFGNQRIFNGVKKNPHTGLDIAAPEGRDVRAAAAGRVVLSGGDYFYSGNMVVLDHGQGLQTIYAHLKNTLVAVGDVVSQGQSIGTVGKTGRATGPHLHWGVSLNNVRFNPQSLLGLNKNMQQCKEI